MCKNIGGRIVGFTLVYGRSSTYVDVYIMPLSRQKQGFDSPREYQIQLITHKMAAAGDAFALCLTAVMLVTETRGNR